MRKRHFKSPRGRGQNRAPRVPPAKGKSPQAGAYSALLVMGRHCIRELARSSPGRLEHLYMSAAFQAELPKDDSLGQVQNLVASQQLKTSLLSAADLTALAGSDSHQGVVARVSPRRRCELNEILHRFESCQGRGLIVGLDGITDPHNVGAIMRAAECFGVDAVVWSKNRSSGITPVVTKVSAGASELLTCIEVSNLAEAARRIRDAGFWIVVAHGQPGAKDLTEFEFPERTFLILGAEGAGVSHLLLERCDFQVRIAMFGRIDSLNVSQAAAVLLHAARSQSIPGSSQKR